MVSGQWSIINYEWMNYAAKRNNATISRRRNHSPFTIKKRSETIEQCNNQPKAEQ